MRSLDVHHLSTQTSYVATGITNAVQITQEPEQLSLLMKFRAGGSLLVIGCTFGMSLDGASLVGAYSGMLYYPMDLSEVLSLDGPAVFYLAALGSTATISFIRAKSSHGGP